MILAIRTKAAVVVKVAEAAATSTIHDFILLTVPILHKYYLLYHVHRVIMIELLISWTALKIIKLFIDLAFSGLQDGLYLIH